MTDEAFAALNVTKTFPGVRALSDVSLRLRKGSIHALLGENGAGKSTLIKVVSGVHPADSGRLILDGAEITLRDIHDATARGISVVHQERHLIPRFSIGENIMLDRLGRGPLSGIDYPRDPRRGGEMAGGARPRSRSAHPRQPPLGRQDAARRDRQGAVAPVDGAVPRRAHGLADRARDRGAFRPPPPPARPGRLHRLRQPQARGGPRHLRPGDGAARRPQRLREPAAGGHDPRRSRAADDRPGRADRRLEGPRPRDRPARPRTPRRLDRDRPPPSRPEPASRRDPRPLRPRRRRTHRAREGHHRPLPRHRRHDHGEGRNRHESTPSAPRATATGSATSRRTARARA